MKRLSLLKILVVGFACHSAAQTIIERSVISPFYINGNAAGIEVYSTGGQTAYRVIGTTSEFLVEGFEQPWDKIPLLVDYHVIYDKCNEVYNVVIDSIVGCATLGSAQVRWGGLIGDELYSSEGSTVLLEVSGAPDCYFSKEIDLPSEVSAETDCQLTFYSYLTPNGDGKNDQWIIDGVNQPRYLKNDVSIINRWGQRVWSASGYNNTEIFWEGLDSNNQLLPDGTYFYSVETNGENYSGYIELQR
ncbi:MAG: gliding motility-associated C-terminal domain-containing protein [Crocinitomicaceae bacterium]|nr:gliding motility-associated C-terminal domain-containing protein [Crocinitomicaceae bacterium]